MISVLFGFQMPGLLTYLMIASSAKTYTQNQSCFIPMAALDVLLTPTLAQQPPKIRETIRTMLVQLGTAAWAAAATRPGASFFN